MRCFDIVIIGGGLVGALMARLLAQAQLGLSVLVIDEVPATAMYSESTDNRGLALGYGVGEVLQRLGLWNTELLTHSASIQQVHVSEQNRFAKVLFAAAEYGLPELGRVVNVSRLGAVLATNLENLPTVEVVRPARATALTFMQDKQRWQVTLSDSTVVQAKLLIGADGTNSMVRQMLHVPIKTVEHKQTAIVANIHTSLRDKGIAYERFTAQGILALLPLQPYVMKCVLTVSDRLLPVLQAQDDTQFLALIQHLFGWRLGKLTCVSMRKYFGLQQVTVPDPVGPGYVLLGNAAHTLHPVAAQGFSLGVRDCVALAKVLRRGVTQGKGFYGIDLLQEYARLRAQENQRLLKFTEYVVHAFTGNDWLVQESRNIALFSAQMLPMVKNIIVRYGAGICM